MYGLIWACTDVMMVHRRQILQVKEITMKCDIMITTGNFKICSFFYSWNLCNLFHQPPKICTKSASFPNNNLPLIIWWLQLLASFNVTDNYVGNLLCRWNWVKCKPSQWSLCSYPLGNPIFFLALVGKMTNLPEWLEALEDSVMIKWVSCVCWNISMLNYEKKVSLSSIYSGK